MSNHTNVESHANRLACKSCKGCGTWSSGEIGPYKCHGCGGTGHFEVPDDKAIIAEISGRRGLRSKRPESDRAYYVWRMARWHGGADVTMPVFAASHARYDPFIDRLDRLAEAVAKAAFGTDLAAAHRWGRLFGLIDPNGRTPGLPATAYESGPVLGDGVAKPDCEMLELR